MSKRKISISIDSELLEKHSPTKKKDITIAIKEFVAENKATYQTAIKNREEKLSGETISARYHKIYSSKGEREGYFYTINGEEHCSKTIAEAKEDMATRGYRIKTTWYRYAEFINDEIAEQNKRIEEANDIITDALREIREKATTFMVENFKLTYVRFGEIPESRKSYNFRDGHSEAGVSVFEAIEFDGEYFINIFGKGNIFTYAGLAHKSCYNVEGKRLEAAGSDGEPLLQNVKIIRKINEEKVGTVDDFISKIFS